MHTPINNIKHGPPTSADTTTASARPDHTQILTESSVASIFAKRYRGRIIRQDFEDGDSNFIVPCTYKYDEDGNYIPLIDGGVVPDSFVLCKIRQLIDELSADADAFTAIRIGCFAFARGVFNYLMIDPDMAFEHVRKKRGSYYYSQANQCAEQVYAKRSA